MDHRAGRRGDVVPDPERPLVAALNPSMGEILLKMCQPDGEADSVARHGEFDGLRIGRREIGGCHRIQVLP